MNLLTSCPDEQDWRNFLDGTGSESDQLEFFAHLEVCPQCEDYLGRQAPPQTPFPRQVRKDVGKASVNREILANLARYDEGRVESRRSDALETFNTPPTIEGLTDFVQLGQGGMGVVYHAIETDLDRPVAVKLLTTVGLANQASRMRAQHEALTLARLRHPHVVQIYWTGEFEGVPYIVMEWVPGGTLKQQIEKGCYPPRDAADLVRDLALAVGAAHALGIIHRDLKPENVLLAPATSPSGRPVAKLADFGLALPAQNDEPRAPGLTENGLIVGTPSYIAPEQTGLDPALGKVSQATDIHGLGAILYAMLSGQAPYEAKSSRESLQRASQGSMPSLRVLCPKVPADLRTIVEKCLELIPARRYRSAGELADDLTRFLEGRPILARPIGPVERLTKWGRRRPALAVATALGALLLVLTAAAVGRNVYLLNQVSRATVERNSALKDGEKALHEKNQALTVAQEALEREKQAVEKRQQVLASTHDERVMRLLRRGAALDPQDRAFLLDIRKQYLDWPLEPDPLAAHKSRAQGLLTLRQIFLNLHQYEEAYQTALLARSEYERAMEFAPSDPELAKQRLQAGMFVHNCLAKTDRHAERELISRQLVEQTEQLVKADPSARKLLASALVDHSYDLQQLKQFEASRELVARSIELYKQCSTENPTDETVRFNEIRANHNVILCDNAGSQLPGSQIPQYQILLKLTEDAVNAFPQNRLPYQTYQRIALLGLADGYRKLGQFDKATAAVNRTLELCRSVLKVADDKQQNLAPFLEGLIDCAITKFEICFTQGRSQEARADLENAVTMARLNRDKEPAVFQRSWTLLRVMLRWADFLTVTEQPEDAQRHLVEVFELTKQWDTEKDHAWDIHDLQSMTLTRLINLANYQQDHASAERWIAEKLRIAKPEERPELLIQQKRHRVVLSERTAATHVQP